MNVATVPRKGSGQRRKRQHAELMRMAEDIARMSDMVAKQAVEFFKLLADETRLRIVYVLKQCGEVNVQTMCRMLKLTQPAVSHHLALLRVAGLIRQRREGKHNYYSLEPDRFLEQAGILNNFLPNPSVPLDVPDGAP